MNGRIDAIQTKNNRRFNDNNGRPDTMRAQNQRQHDTMQAEMNRRFDAMRVENSRQRDDLNRHFNEIRGPAGLQGADCPG